MQFPGRKQGLSGKSIFLGTFGGCGSSLLLSAQMRMEILTLLCVHPQSLVYSHIPGCASSLSFVHTLILPNAHSHFPGCASLISCVYTHTLLGIHIHALECMPSHSWVCNLTLSHMCTVTLLHLSQDTVSAGFTASSAGRTH